MLKWDLQVRDVCLLVITTPQCLMLSDLHYKNVSVLQYLLGKQVIHPNQLDVVNGAFSPSREKIEWARELVKAFEEQQKEGIVSYL